MRDGSQMAVEFMARDHRSRVTVAKWKIWISLQGSGSNCSQFTGPQTKCGLLISQKKQGTTFFCKEIFFIKRKEKSKCHADTHVIQIVFRGYSNQVTGLKYMTYRLVGTVFSMSGSWNVLRLNKCLTMWLQ